MKKTQPDYKKCTIKCACGNTIEAGSIKDSMSVEICSACHPFFTGTKQAIMSQGRAAKFMEKFGTKK